MPRYVEALLQRICADPAAVQPLFRTALPDRADGARIRLWRYHFSTPQQREETDEWWQREALGTTRPMACSLVREAALDTMPTRLDDRRHGSHFDRWALQNSCAP